jgi:hypothetical protein
MLIPIMVPTTTVYDCINNYTRATITILILGLK